MTPTPPAQGYQPLDRPWAFVQWVKKYAADIEEDYVLQSEPDHIFLRPPPMWATPTKPAAAPFDYMEPENPFVANLMAGFNKKNIPIDQFDATGEALGAGWLGCALCGFCGLFARSYIS